MIISLLTPTADQPLGIALLERYIARQTVAPDEWVVADDGHAPARLTLGQTHLVRARHAEGGRSLAGNVLAALEVVRGDIVILAEHDDWYAPDHIALCVERLARAKATGSRWQRYYHVPSRRHVTMRNMGSALCNTALRAELLPRLRRAAEQAWRERSYGVDRLFWELIRGEWDIHDLNTVVGIKGLPGRPGLGLGHRPDARRPWRADPDGAQLRAWCGEDAAHYLALVGEAAA